MATKQMFDTCTQRNKELGRSNSPYKKLYAPKLKSIFGSWSLIDESEIQTCSEAEKNRHLYENRVLRFLYIEN